jgi:hypothetical protein
MDHQEQHHQHHRKEREHAKEKRKEHEHEQEQQTGLRAIHPAWFVAVGVVFIALIVLVWNFWWLP